MSLRSRSHVNASIIVMRPDDLCINNYIISFLNNILRPILMVRTRLEPVSYRMCVLRLNQLSYTGSWLIRIYIYINLIQYYYYSHPKYIIYVIKNKYN